MGKGRVAAFCVAVAIVGLGIMRTATASHGGGHQAFSGGASFKGLVVKTAEAAGGTFLDVTTLEPTWQTVDSRGFSIPAGESQLIVVDVNALVTCSGSGAYCSARIVVGRMLSSAAPLLPSGLSNFLAEATSVDGDRRALSKALCVQNPTAAPINVSVWFQAAGVTGGGTLDDYRIHDYTFKIARNTPCTDPISI